MDFVESPAGCRALRLSRLITIEPIMKTFPISRRLLLLPLAGLILACASCSKPDPPKPPAPVTDTEPVGSGLKVIGFAVLGAAVVCVLGRMLD
jgi:hypothetical protein